MTETNGDGARRPERPLAEIIADIEKERTALLGSLGSLRSELEEAVDAGRQKAVDAGRRAVAVGPLVAAVVLVLAAATLLLRRRSRRRS
jgi:hypothetical protein